MVKNAKMALNLTPCILFRTSTKRKKKPNGNSIVRPRLLTMHSLLGWRGTRHRCITRNSSNQKKRLVPSSVNQSGSFLPWTKTWEQRSRKLYNIDRHAMHLRWRGDVGGQLDPLLHHFLAPLLFPAKPFFVCAHRQKDGCGENWVRVRDSPIDDIICQCLICKWVFLRSFRGASAV